MSDNRMTWEKVGRVSRGALWTTIVVIAALAYKEHRRG